MVCVLELLCWTVAAKALLSVGDSLSVFQALRLSDSGQKALGLVTSRSMAGTEVCMLITRCRVAKNPLRPLGANPTKAALSMDGCHTVVVEGGCCQGHLIWPSC